MLKVILIRKKIVLSAMINTKESASAGLTNENTSTDTCQKCGPSVSSKTAALSELKTPTLRSPQMNFIMNRSRLVIYIMPSSHV